MMLEQQPNTPNDWPDYTDSAFDLLAKVKGVLEVAHARHKVHRGEPVPRVNTRGGRSISCDVVFSEVRYRTDRNNALRFDMSLYVGHGVYGTVETVGLITALRQDLFKRVSAVVDQSKVTAQATGFEVLLRDGSLTVESEMKQAGAVIKTHLWIRASALDQAMRSAYACSS